MTGHNQRTLCYDVVRDPTVRALPAAEYNFDHPDAFDQAAIIDTLNKLKVSTAARQLPSHPAS